MGKYTKVEIHFPKVLSSHSPSNDRKTISDSRVSLCMQRIIVPPLATHERSSFISKKTLIRPDHASSQS